MAILPTMHTLLSRALGLVVLVAVERLGHALAAWAGLPLPGGVAGFVLLFLALFLWRELPAPLADVSSALLSHLSLFLVPSVVAAAVAFRFSDIPVVFLLGCGLVVTLLSALACGLAVRWVERRTAGARRG